MRIAVGTIIAQKYRLEGQVARGGMGAVWAARHMKLGSLLAIKFLDAKLAASPAFVARFEREARAAATIQSPHVVQVHDFGFEEGTPYIVMELLRGEDLRMRLRRVGRLSMSEASGLLVQLGKALRRAHEAGIVHRDIKPGNLFLARSDDDEILKVLDFGIAKQPDEVAGESTRTGEIIGSPHYVSPEQGRCDKDVDHRTDVWSVGVIAFRMLTGHLPFPGEGLGNVLAKILVEPPPTVRAFDSTLPEALDAFFAIALAKNRDDRFQSVRELVEAFVSIARTVTVEESIPPPSWSAIMSVSMPPPEPGSSPAVPPAASPPPPSAPRASLPSLARAPSPPPSAPPPPFSDHFSTGLDSLTPATGSHLSPARPVVRFRWAIVAAIGLLVAGALTFVWMQGEQQLAPSTASSPGVPAPADNPPLPAPEPGSSDPWGAAPRPGPLPGASSTAKVSLSATASAQGAPAPTVSAAPSMSAAPPPRSANVPSPLAPPSGAASRRNWGF